MPEKAALPGQPAGHGEGPGCVESERVGMWLGHGMGTGAG